MAKALPAETKLNSTTVFFRIRPFDTDGATPGHSMGDATAVKLDGWDDTSITMTDSARTQHVFDYPTRVLGPTASQDEAYDAMLPDLVDAWLHKGNNLMVLAYGQTGTGKTHTMLGPKESLASETVHPDWGILPRVVHTCLEHIATQRGSVACVLAASAIEFYMGMGFDLLNDHSHVEVNPDGEAQGHSMRVLESMSDLSAVLEDLERNRTTAATKMNSSSSRSHCCMLLTLFQLDLKTRTYAATKFNLIDLAGSERAVRAGGGPPLAGADLITYFMMAMNGQVNDIPVGVQGQLINLELFGLTMEIMRATEMYRKKRQYNPPKSCSSAFQRYTGAIMMGRTLLTTIVCCSPSPQNGMENLNSLKWGKGMAVLRAPNIPEKWLDIEKVHKAAVATAERAAAEFAGAPRNKFWVGRKSRAEHGALIVSFMERLLSA